MGMYLLRDFNMESRNPDDISLFSYWVVLVGVFVWLYIDRFIPNLNKRNLSELYRTLS